MTPAGRTTCLAVALTAASFCGCDGGRCDGGDSGASSVDAQSGGFDAGSGQVLVDAGFTNCASVSSIAQSPNNGGTVHLTASVNDAPEDGATPAALWTAPSGTFADSGALDTTFTCAATVHGTVVLTLTLSSPGCDQHGASTVTCM